MRHAHAWMKLSRAVDGIDLDNVLLSALNSADLPHGTCMLCPTFTYYLLSNVVIFSQLKSNMIWRGSCSTIVQNGEIDWQYPEIPLNHDPWRLLFNFSPRRDCSVRKAFCHSPWSRSRSVTCW